MRRALAAVSLLLALAHAVSAAPFREMTESGCQAYAADAHRLALIRDAGVAREDALVVFDALRVGFYGEEIWPYLLDLLSLTYASTTEPKAWARDKYLACLERGGVERVTLMGIRGMIDG